MILNSAYPEGMGLPFSRVSCIFLRSLYVFAFVSFFAFSSSVIAEEEIRPPADPMDISWGQPILGESVGEDKVKVDFIGRTEPGTVVTLDKMSLIVVDVTGGAALFHVITKGEYPFKVSNTGEFRIQLELPYGALQIPFRFEGPSGKSKAMQLIVQVKKDAIILGNVSAAAPLEHNWLRSNMLSAGLGCNYQTYDQTSEGPAITMSSFNCPTNFGEAKIVLDSKWQMMASARSTPGQVKLMDPLVSTSESFRWLSLIGEFAYSPESWRGHLFGYKWFGSFRFGGQHHSVPFLLVRQSVGGKNEVVLENGTMSTVSIGGMSEWEINDRTIFEIFLRYQQPLFYGGVFSAKSSFIFDGSIGASRRLSEKFVAGLFWLGQSHQYSYEYKGGSALLNGAGNQKLFFSIFEFRLGYQL